MQVPAQTELPEQQVDREETDKTDKPATPTMPFSIQMQALH
jgi:hypothetical protein